MSSFLPVSSALGSTVLCVYGCYLYGMRGADLILAGTVAGVVSVTTALTVQLLAARQVQKSR